MLSSNSQSRRADIKLSYCDDDTYLGGKTLIGQSFMAENTVLLLLTALIRNFYKAIIQRLDVKRFGLNATSRIKAFVFMFVSVPAKWTRISRRYVLNIYICNNAYADVFQTDFG